MNIVVLVKEVPDTWGERHLDTSTGFVDRAASDAVIDEVDERALEAALAIKDADRSVIVTVLSVAPYSATGSLRKSLAIGADAAIHIADPVLRGADAVLTGQVIAAVLARIRWDLLFAGNESTDGRGGAVPAIVAELVGTPALTFVDSVEVSGGRVSAVRTTDEATLHVSAELPAVVSVTERSPEARMAGLRGTLGARKKPIETLSLVDLGLAGAASRSRMRTAERHPPRTAGPRVVDDGTAAAQLADFLVSRGLA